MFTTWLSSTAAANPDERRIDPHDGKSRTFTELKALWSKDYTLQQMQEYWNNECKLSVGTRLLAQDPFLTSVHDLGTRQMGTRQLTTLQQNPFLTGMEQEAGTRQLTNLEENPFLTGIRAPRTTNLGQLTGTLQKDATKVSKAFLAFLGPGDPTRLQAARLALVLGPFAVFLWVMCLWLFLYHFSHDACTVLTALVGLACAGIVLLWSLGNWTTVGPAPLLPFGLLSMAALLAGIIMGQTGLVLHWRQWWWFQTGQYFDGTTATTPAGSRVDGAILSFRNSEGTYNGTYVDNLRSAGFKDTHMYCVAPILSALASDASLLRVNYWAVGMDCCEESGGFSCDDSRKPAGGYGMVMLNHGFPCPDCNVGQFEKAIVKAQALHGLVSAPGFLFVRWVASAQTTRTVGLLQGVLYFLMSLVFAFFTCFLLGSLAWYYGIGKSIGSQPSEKSK